ncbi:tryptophan 7-halogenase [Janthinobacterium sp. SUN100]|uniref:tryptophan 7-halogenase n=1 Tax=Janthinobacterium sp. SUN100 TaxID=3004101 RepID=UPI0025B10D26|nr:tryptophan 7-halogenase [Janthinobacterium sp. SUN100]MDN2700428.1 tryptophan 7-halogenase [Janthinobacterium sp. SUN100]
MTVLQADVLVVGAGPAGATAALNLAGRHRVLLVDRLAAPLARIGESLPPAAARLLQDMGLLDAFLRQGHAPYHGNRAWWNGAWAEHHFLSDPDGHGWHLERGTFDLWLRDEARQRGAALLASARVADIAPDDGGWRVRLETRHGPCDAAARIVIDATGRSARLARKAGAQRRHSDRLVSIWQYGHERTPSARGFAHIEACEYGWWYSAPLPGQRRVLALHTDADLLGNTSLRDAGWLEAAARRLPATRELLEQQGYGADTPALATPAHTAALDAAAGPGWFAAGDAALSFDPLSSQGIFNALYTGLAAAEAADRTLQGDTTACQQYNAELAAIGAAYGRHLAYCYGQETRWPSAPFWSRRRPLAAR